MNAHLFEHAKHFWFFQSQVPHPRSLGAAVFAGEKTHYPSTRSYPAKQLKQSPEALSKELHWELTATQRPLALKKLLSEHARHDSFDQVLHRRFDSGTMLVSTWATQAPSTTMDP